MAELSRAEGCARVGGDSEGTSEQLRGLLEWGASERALGPRRHLPCGPAPPAPPCRPWGRRTAAVGGVAAGGAREEEEEEGAGGGRRQLSGGACPA